MFKRMALVAASLALVVAACSETTPATTTSTPATTTTSVAAAFPVEVGGVTIESQPTAIVSGSATHTETLYAIGVGDRVVATDAFSDHPAAALETEKFDSFNISVEAVAAFDPDLVVLAFDPGDVVAGLATLGIPTLLFDAPADIEAAYTQILDLGAATGATDEAADLVTRMRDEIDKIVSDLPPLEAPVTYFHELSPSLFTVSSDSFIGSVYGLLGLDSIVSSDAGPFPQLSAEFVVESDPTFIFLGDGQCCGESPETVAARPGWGEMSAVQEGNVIVVDEDISSRWGPRLVDFVRAVAAAVYGSG